ncbi:hypothetical protein AAVH_16852 [Aphelenchoides avenae]|nr:hypothetical protein AAVH_16852 [Aphelenchus avenae]
MTIDYSPDSGVSMDSKESTPVSAPQALTVAVTEPSVPKDEDDSADLDHMEVDLSGEQLPEERQLKPRRPILKAHRGADRVPHKLTIQFEDDTNVYSSPTSSRRPSTPHPRKRLMIEEVALVAQEHPSKRSRHSSVSIDTSLDSEDALSTPRRVAIPPNGNTIHVISQALSSKLPSMPRPNSSAFQFITCDVRARRLSKLTEEQFLSEYTNAISIHNAEELPDIFFPADEQLIKTKSRTPIIYCEFLQKRGPAVSSAVSTVAGTRILTSTTTPSKSLKDGYKNIFERGFLVQCAQEDKRSLGVSEPPAGISDDPEATNASSMLQPFSLAATNTAPHSSMPSVDFGKPFAFCG